MPYSTIEEDETLQETPEDSHVIHFWEPLEFEVDRKYEYVPKNKLFRLASNVLYYGIAYPVLTLINKLFLGLKIEGKENLKKIKNTGAVTIANHAHMLDCTIVGISSIPRKVYFTSLESNFKIPVVNVLIRLLNTLPIPTERASKKEFIETIDSLLKEGKIVHFYPEGSLWPYCERLRGFKNGAFDFAVRNQVPILPYVIEFRKPDGIYQWFKKKPCITVTILKPIEPPKEEGKMATQKLKEIVYQKMQNQIKRGTK